MGIQKKGLGVLCLLLTLCLLLSGCRESSSLVRYDISNGVESLDPQFASEENEQLVIYNMMEGLMRQKPSGELTNGAIERYEVSDDQKVYTFFPGGWDGVGRQGEHAGHRTRLCLCFSAHL